jgi:hypothetical protein
MILMQELIHSYDQTTVQNQHVATADIVGALLSTIGSSDCIVAKAVPFRPANAVFCCTTGQKQFSIDDISIPFVPGAIVTWIIMRYSLVVPSEGFRGKARQSIR